MSANQWSAFDLSVLIAAESSVSSAVKNVCKQFGPEAEGSEKSSGSIPSQGVGMSSAMLYFVTAIMA